MPLRGNPVCIRCNAEESPIWTNAESLGAICLNCINEAKSVKDDEEDEKAEGKGLKRKGRTTRSGKTRQSLPTTAKVAVTKTGTGRGRGRRFLRKGIPIKAPTAVATPVTSDSVYYKGFYYQKGDIVSIMDPEDNLYYAQIRGFLTDQYCEKSAVLTWLLPTKESPSPKESFDPATYILGPEEEISRQLDCLEFVMHAPSDYYKCKTTPYPTVYPTAKPGFIWTSLEPVQRLVTGHTSE